MQIYAHRTQSEDRRNQQLPSPEPHVSSPPVIGLQKVAPVQQVQSIPDITPMRRGRPTAPVQQPSAAKPSPSPMRGTTSDPFAALDSNNVEVRRAAADELAARFPSLDEFSLLHDRGQKFEFGQSPPPADPQLNKRVMEALADDAFAFPSATKTESAPQTKPSPATPSTGVSRSASVKKPQRYEGSKDSPRDSNPTILQPAPQRPTMVSTGMQTSPAPTPAPGQAQQKYPDVNKRPIWRVPDTSQHNRTLSQPRTLEKPLPSPSALKPDYTLPTRPALLDSRSKSQASNLTIPRSPASSRPSLESQRPSPLDLGNALDRSKSAQSRARPSSIHVESNLDFLREREAAPGRSFDAPSLSKGPPSAAIQDSDSEPDDRNITSNVGFLRAMENDDSTQKKHRRSSSQSKHTKRSSLSSITSNTKNIVKGKFGDAFRKFESNSAPPADRSRVEPPLTPTDLVTDARGKTLTPIAGSEATGGDSDDERVRDETQDLPPEVRRELERRRLSEEERRVEAAAAEYRRRLAEEGKGKAGPTRASTIQNRVKNLLDESQKQTPVNRTAEGYGHYTDSGKPLPTRPQDQSGMKPSVVARKPVPLPQQSQPQHPPVDLSYAKPRHNITQPPSSSSVPPMAHRTATGGSAPRAPPKPKALRTGGPSDHASNPIKSTPGLGGIGPGRDKPLPPVGAGQHDGAADEGDWDMDSFSKRYPSLSGLEMVETEIPRSLGSRGGVRDV